MRIAAFVLLAALASLPVTSSAQRAPAGAAACRANHPTVIFFTPRAVRSFGSRAR
jgi:hypothetical protein